MDRRDMLTSLGVFGLGSAIRPGSLIEKEEIQKTSSATSFGAKRFALGQLELIVVSDGYLLAKPVQSMFAPYIDPALVSKVLEENFRPTDHAELGMQILLIRSGGKLIMIDSGNGQAAETTGRLPVALKDAGIDPKSITDIVLTHAHPDHIGGLVDNSGALTFPSAVIHLSRTEYDFWLSENPDFSKSAMKAKPEFIAMVLARIRSVLGAIKPKLQFFVKDEVILDCIRLVPAPGHTPGLTLMNVFSGSSEIIHIADLIHSDVLLFPHPEWGFAGDTDMVKASQMRRQILERLADHKTHTLAYHLPWPGLGYVRRKGEAFEWVPDVYPTP